MLDLKKDHLDESLTGIGILDLIFVVPFSVLFSYLPLEHWWQWIINIIIVVFCALGASYLFITIKAQFKSKRH
ncbi:DUF6007 family protein [Staphylococcus cornubiensis]|uniref:DUF6007 family protein n=1 Tax=Staphylococcus cornubiensis TaxID=1986155 RepID=UPI001F0A24C5|nr:DUF6007 family protein [Staphylococcus cornubiensis]